MSARVPYIVSVTTVHRIRVFAVSNEYAVESVREYGDGEGVGLETTTWTAEAEPFSDDAVKDTP